MHRQTVGHSLSAHRSPLSLSKCDCFVHQQLRCRSRKHTTFTLHTTYDYDLLDQHNQPACVRSTNGNAAENYPSHIKGVVLMQLIGLTLFGMSSTQSELKTMRVFNYNHCIQFCRYVGIRYCAHLVTTSRLFQANSLKRHKNTINAISCRSNRGYYGISYYSFGDRINWTNTFTMMVSDFCNYVIWKDNEIWIKLHWQLDAWFKFLFDDKS